MSLSLAVKSLTLPAIESDEQAEAA
jgi:hypothetical protein